MYGTEVTEFNSKIIYVHVRLTLFFSTWVAELCLEKLSQFVNVSYIYMNNISLFPPNDYRILYSLFASFMIF